MSRETSARFEPIASEAGAARSFVRGVLERWKIDSEDAVLLANELATNAIIHARGPFDLVLERRANRLRVLVRDDNTRLPELPLVPLDALSGRGLALVVALATDWGIDAVSGSGKVIWFEVEIRPAP